MVNAGLTEANAVRFDAAVGAFRQAAAGTGTPFALARAANSVSAPMDVLYDVYAPPIPTSVLRLDYLGRELLLDGEENKLADARAHLDTARSTWAGLSPRVNAAGSTAESAEMDAVLKDIDGAIASADVENLKATAKRELDIVDNVEKVFANQKVVDGAD